MRKIKINTLIQVNLIGQIPVQSLQKKMVV